jgi:hypothetical protein
LIVAIRSGSPWAYDAAISPAGNAAEVAFLNRRRDDAHPG